MAAEGKANVAEGLDQGPAFEEEDSVLLEEATKAFARFFSELVQTSETATKIQTALEKDNPTVRFDLNLDELRDAEPELAKKLLAKPLSYYKAALDGIRSAFDGRINADDIKRLEIFLAVVGAFGPYLVNPRGLKANFLSKMVSVEGIVTKMGLVKPKLVELAQFCRETSKYRQKMTFHDGTDISGHPPESVVFPTVDDEGHPLEVEFGECKYRDYQKFTIQEMPERAPLGQLPRSVEVICEDDLVDLVKPGDRVCCTGIYRAINVRSVAEISGMFKTALVCNSVQKLGKDIGGIQIPPEELAVIKEIAAQPDAFEKLAKSLAPSIYGHEYVKKAILLLLLGGTEKVLENGTHLRGDINMLVVGDPSTAKSQLLRFVLGIAPLAISTTGRGSTGVGLTAAVTTDPDSGERRLEAGAMVLADRGVVLIDEFDKMGDGDRVAIHEVMEQQTVTIAKAGIHASLNARCSVVAAANPIYGQYNKDLSPQRNIGLPDSLLSRFDLLFVVLDNSSADTDRAVADHVLRIHRYQEPGKEGKPVPLNEPSYSYLTKEDNNKDDDEEDEFGVKKFKVYEKFNPVLHPQYARSSPLFSIDFMRKFIFAAKSLNRAPKLTEEARQIISDEYATLRSEQATKTLPITPRCLETLIRLSTAHAKCRFSSLIEAQDVEVAREVLRFALYNDTEKAEERRKQLEKQQQTGRKRVSAEMPSDDEEEEIESDEDEVAEVHSNNQKRARSDDSDEVEEVEAELRDPPARPRADLFEADPETRTNFFIQTLRDFSAKHPEGEFPLRTFATHLNGALKTASSSGTHEKQWRPFTDAEISNHLRALDGDNVIMFRDSIIYPIGI